MSLGWPAGANPGGSVTLGTSNALANSVVNTMQDKYEPAKDHVASIHVDQIANGYVATVRVNRQETSTFITDLEELGKLIVAQVAAERVTRK